MSNFTWTDIKDGERADPAPINNLGNHVAAYRGLRLARKVILTEAVSAIQFSTDDDGNALNSTFGGELRVYIPANASISTIAAYYIQLNGLTSGCWFSITQNATYVSKLYGGSARSTSKSIIDITGGHVMAVSYYAAQYNTGTADNNTVYGGINASQSAITAINLYFSGYTFPIGTVVEWWERG